jgi:aminoglycoside phosphotransferase (APT) family kinase protein
MLHRPAPPDAPHNPWRSGPLETRADTFEQRLKELDAHVDGPALRRIWDDALGADRHRGPLLWCHGDLHPANTLIRDGAVAGVIDFGDLCAADPAVDVGGAWMSIPDSSLDRFWASYGTRDPDLARRGRGWAVFFSLLLLQIGLEGHVSYANVGRGTLARIVGGAPG